jgi:ketosteroid isomerase-like protein
MNVPQGALDAMQRTNELFNSRVVGRREIGALDRVYTKDARVLPPGAPMQQGREQAKAFWQAALQALGVKSAKLSTVDAEAIADRIFEIGRAELVVGSDETVTAKYVVQWKQEDGDWKWHVDIWNMDQ